MGSVAASKLIRPTPARQEQLDIFQLYCLLHYYKHCGGKGVVVDPPEDIPVIKQYEKVHVEVTHQIKQLLKDFHDFLQSINEPFRGFHEKFKLPSHHFTLEVQKSSIKHPEAGKGVFLHGGAVPGTFLMFHPGLVYLPLDIRKMPNYPQIDRNNMYLMSRYDGCILDAKNFDTNIQALLPSQQHTESFVAHPYANGHMVNHPPPGKEANIMPFSYDVLDNFPTSLQYLIPNRYFRKPGFLHKTQAVMRTIVFIATKHIENEELFVNYRLNPEGKLPSWYSPVDVQEDLRRWKISPAV